MRFFVCFYLQREEELLSSWWREYAECSEGPRERQSSGTKLDRHQLSEEIEEERVGVPVKGGLYEVLVLYFLSCFPVDLIMIIINIMLFLSTCSHDIFSYVTFLL